MVQIQNNFPNKLPKNPCICGSEENQEHIYRCKIFNDRKPKSEYLRIFDENVKIQKDILERFKENYEKRNEIMRRNESVPLDPCGRSTVITCPCYNSNGWLIKNKIKKLSFLLLI